MDGTQSSFSAALEALVVQPAEVKPRSAGFFLSRYSYGPTDAG